ncbi:FAD assembly factor SdhE [Kushneria aurantia]|uniref:FAD assembly factor SdhE n=1 Tax=Kushneria aurantia TaxID=504092 RepID=A0ABV6G7U1_9GAMM|nr:succinate dehydrogenase assembly factor 2 [Kushneria aurantia]
MDNAIDHRQSIDDVNRRRLYWHSRRGMWELDLMLVPFFENRFDALEAPMKEAYRQLLAQEDQDLFSWLMRRDIPADDTLGPIVLEIIRFAEQTHTGDVRPL